MAGVVRGHQSGHCMHCTLFLALLLGCCLQNPPAFYMTPEVASGLLGGGLLLMISLCGICCLTGIQSPRTFEKKPGNKGR